MIIVFSAATILFVIEIASIIELRKEAKEIKLRKVENLIGDAYKYRFVESDYERVEQELIKFVDELAYAI